MKHLFPILTAFLLTSCAGFADKATLAYGQSSDKFETSTGITLGQGFNILTGALSTYQANRAANKLQLDHAGSPLPPWPPVQAQPATTSAKATATPPEPVLTEPEKAWWNTLFL